MAKQTMQEVLAKRKAKVYGRFIFTFLVNGVGAPFIDKCRGYADRNGSWSGYAIQMNPFNFNRFGERNEGVCFVIGLFEKKKA